MSKKKKENQKSRPSEEGWPLGKATRKGNGENGFDRFSRSVHGTLVRLLSNLRLSLTLRIALHFSGQLLLTTLPVLAAAMIALCGEADFSEMYICLLYTSPSPRDISGSRMPSSA